MTERIPCTRRAAEIVGQARQPLFADRFLDDLQQWPCQPLGQPRILVRVDARRGRDGFGYERGWGGELDPGADPVGAARGGSEHGRHPLRQPSLHAARRYGDDLGGEWVLERVGAQRGQSIGEAVGAVGSVD